MKLIREYVAKQINRTMGLKGLEQGDIASGIEIEQSNVSRWLSGQTLPSDENFEQYCKLIGMSKEDVLFPKGELKSDLIVSIVALLPSLDEGQLRSAFRTISNLSSGSSALNARKTPLSK